MRPLDLACVVVAATAACCAPRSSFLCFADGECGGAGVCQSTGFCSFPDDACESGHRYGEHAPDRLSGTCVPVGEGTGSGGTTTTPPAVTSATTLEPPSDDSTSTSSAASTVGLSSGVDFSSTGAPAGSSSDTGEPLDPDLVAWYRFETEPAAGVLDDTEHLLHGVCDDGRCPTLVKGVEGMAARFDGTDDHVRIPYDPLLDTTDAWTISLWLSADELDETTSCSPIARPYGPEHEDSYELYIRSDDGVGPPTVHFIIGGVQPAATIELAPPFGVGEWVHVAATWDAAMLRLYIDGTEVGSAPALECVFDDHDLLLGADINGIEPPSNFFAGALDDVRVYARALDADEVAELAAR